MFRDEDYLPPKEDEPEQASAQENLETLETALVSVCPRCGEVCTVTYNNIIQGVKDYNNIIIEGELL